MSNPRHLETTMLGDAPVPADDLIAGRYRLLGLVGAGGVGRVYRALDQDLGEVVALKVLRADLATDAASLDRFVQEARLARRVTHKNVARTFDIGEHGGLRFLTMEYVEGRSLAALIDSHATLPEARAVSLGRAVLEGLSAAHEVGVVHRDLKPENVLVAADGRVVLTDFGIARDTAGLYQTAGRVMGTPAYMAPEQLEAARDLDARVDVYAFGEIAYELLTGRRAWPGESFVEIVSARLLRDPPDPRRIRPISDALAKVVLRCMARRREDRYPDARATIAAWDAASGGAEVGTSTPPPARAESAASAGTSVAVLPVQNLGGADDAFLADGLTDDLIDALSMIATLRVRPRGMVARFAARDVDPREAGRSLEVEAVVEASLRRTPTGVRLTARLLGVADGFQLWARRFDCSIGELLVASDEAARAVAEALAVRFDAPLRKAPTDGSAVEVYLRARGSLRRNWYPQSTEAPSETLALFGEALRRAPEDPLILAGLAMARARFARSPTELGEARAVAQRAIVAGPRLGEPWVAMATLYRHEGDARGQVAALRRALEMAPRQVEAHYQLGRLFLEVGPLSHSLSTLELAVTLDPTDDEIRASLAMARAAAGDLDAGVATLLGATRGNATHPLMALVRARIRLWSRGSVKSDGERGSDPYLALVDGAIRDARVPPAAESDLVRTKRPPRLIEQLLAEVYFATGDVVAGLSHTTRSVDFGLSDVVWAEHCPLLDAARTHAAWAGLRTTLAERAEDLRMTMVREGLLSA